MFFPALVPTLTRQSASFSSHRSPPNRGRPDVPEGGSPTAGPSAVARKKTSKVRVDLKQLISQRLREVRQERFGEHGGPELARRLDLPARTWYNYETGVTVPAEVLLSFIDQTGTNPGWLFNGEGPKFSRPADDRNWRELSPEDLIRRGLEKLERQNPAAYPSSGINGDPSAEFVAVPMIPLEELGDQDGTLSDPNPDGQSILASRDWLPHPSKTVAVRLADDAMHPILSQGSVVAVDRSVTDPAQLQGKLVAAWPDPDRSPMIRWLEVSGRHLILRPNQPSADHPLIPVPRADGGDLTAILGQVVWSWSRFGES